MLRLPTILLNCVLALTLQSFATKVPRSVEHISDSNSCWSTDDCFIAASLEFFSGQILPVTINCSYSKNVIEAETSVFVKRRYENISSVTLDGCEATLNANTFGFEYIPNCERIVSLNLKNFHFDEIYEIICEPGGLSLKSVRFEHNEFARVSATSMTNLATVDILQFHSNKLRHIAGEAFNHLENLKEISIGGESDLVISYARMFRNLIRLEDLHLNGVGQITSELFTNLPENLQNFVVNEAIIDKQQLSVVAPHKLQNLTISNCGLTSMIVTCHEALTNLNLSSNLLREFILQNCTNLMILDLSSNDLTKLSLTQFDQLHHLDHVYLQRNNLKVLSISIFGNSLTHLSTIDLRNNKLKNIEGITDNLSLNVHLRILIDGNPWNCIWLVNVSYRMPQQYRVFRYEKYISKINVNGLECVTYADDSSLTNSSTGQKNTSSPFTIIYGGPRETKRNQKAEALVIVFMLPLGIAILFVLLYLWINCQKVFHWSYYRNLPIVRGSAERFDIERQLPQNNTATLNKNLNQGYEIPLTGCNCTDHDNKMCNRVNLTCEEVPHHNAAKIYEEIIDHTVPAANCYYDHLTFAEHSGGESP